MPPDGRRPSARRVRDEALKVKLRHVHAEHFGVYGARKMWRQLRREEDPGRPLHRRAADAGAGPLRRGAWEGPKRTTVPDESAPRPADLVDRDFGAAGPQPALGRRPHLRAHDLVAASPTSPSSSTPARATSSAGRPRARCAPTSHSTRSSRRCGLGRVPSTGSSTTATAGCSTSRSAASNLRAHSESEVGAPVVTGGPHAAAISESSERQRAAKSRRCSARGIESPRPRRQRKYCRNSSNAEQKRAADAKLPKPRIG